MQPAVPATWVRAGLFYCVLDILYEIVNLFWLGDAGISIVSLLISLILDGLLISSTRRVATSAAQHDRRSGAHIAQERSGGGLTETEPASLLHDTVTGPLPMRSQVPATWTACSTLRTLGRATFFAAGPEHKYRSLRLGL